MADNACANCAGERWVCENHDSEPWTGADQRCCGGAGMPCPVCNNVGPGEFPAMQPGARIICSVFSNGETIQ